MTPDQSTLLARQLGMLPDMYWYQLNGKSAEENWREQYNKGNERMSFDTDNGMDSLHITSEVKIK